MLLQTEVEGRKARTSEDVPAGIAERARRYGLKRCRIEPLVDRLRAFAIADAVRQARRALSDVVVALRDREWPASPAGEDSAEQPVSDDGVDRAIRGSEWQLGDKAGDEPSHE